MGHNNNRPVQIKICGITSESEVECLIQNKVEYAGFVVFYEKSKRNLTPAQAKQLVDKLHAESDIRAVAVVVSPSKEQVVQIMEAGFDLIQIHKDIAEDALLAIEIPIIRAIAEPDTGQTITDITANDLAAKRAVAILFDAKEPGSGNTFDWDRLADFDRGRQKLILAGGIHAGNVASAVKTVAPDVVDISSGVEYDKKSIGKDPAKIREFVGKVRGYE